MSTKNLIPVYSRSEIPHFESAEERAQFWETHELSAELVEEAQRERARLGLPLRGRRGRPSTPAGSAPRNE